MGALAVGFEIVKILAGAVLGFLLKVAYDRWFARRPDLRYAFEEPTTFGGGEKERVYQNLEVLNLGLETANDVRLTFRRPAFDLVEHQIIFDGPHTVEQFDDRTTIVIPNLPLSDRARMSFVFAPSKVTFRKVEDFFLSARASNSVGRPRTSKFSQTEALQPLTAVLGGVATGIALVTLLTTVVGPVVFPRLTGGLNVTPTEPEIVQVVMQSPDAANRGKHIEVEFYVENLSPDPFNGFVEGNTPVWGTTPGDRSEFLEKVSVAAGKRQIVRWRFKIPETALPGRYEIQGEVSGRAFKRYGRVRTSAVIEVK